MRPIALMGCAALFAAVVASGCSHKKDDGTSPVSKDTSLPALTVRDDTPDLMLTWIDDDTPLPPTSRNLQRPVRAEDTSGG